MSAATGQGGGWDTVVRSHREHAEDLLVRAAKVGSAAQSQALATRAQGHATLALLETIEYHAAVQSGAAG